MPEAVASNRAFGSAHHLNENHALLMEEAMAENTAGDSAKQEAVADLTSRIETARKVAAEVATKCDEQIKAIATLAARVEGLHATTTEALASASSQLTQLTAMGERAAIALKQIEEDTRKANSEAGYAFNAKGVAEEHAKAVAQIQGTVQATFAGLTATKASTDELVVAIAAARTASDADAKAIGEAKTEVARDAAQVTAAKERVDAVMPAIDQGTKDANTITAAKSGVEASAAEIRSFQTQMSELTAKATTDGVAIAKTDEDGKKILASMTDARNMANEAHGRLIQYESDIKVLKDAFTAMQAKLEGLLPHATSAGLASAFHIQKARFSKPQPYWLGLFVVAILCLLGATGYGLPASADTWDAILRHFVNRLPIVAPLVWLAIYAGHHYSMALRMEEDYAFKEAVSTAFEGYKREMLAIPAGSANDVSPLVTLCENVLRALAERPGRIYDGRVDVVTPITPAASALREMIAEFMKRKEAKP
jgi:uncharacterized coiled-coil DUF342 family protein